MTLAGQLLNRATAAEPAARSWRTLVDTAGPASPNHEIHMLNYRQIWAHR